MFKIIILAISLIVLTNIKVSDKTEVLTVPRLHAAEFDNLKVDLYFLKEHYLYQTEQIANAYLVSDEIKIPVEINNIVYSGEIKYLNKKYQVYSFYLIPKVEVDKLEITAVILQIEYLNNETFQFEVGDISLTKSSDYDYDIILLKPVVNSKNDIIAIQLGIRTTDNLIIKNIKTSFSEVTVESIYMLEEEIDIYDDLTTFYKKNQITDLNINLKTNQEIKLLLVLNNLTDKKIEELVLIINDEILKSFQFAQKKELEEVKIYELYY